MLAHQLGFRLPGEVKVGSVSGFVADDLPAASYNERSCLSYHCVERDGRSGAIAVLVEH
jgi:hypothetical protein